MHGFHASEERCSYGLMLHVISFALASATLGLVAYLI